MGRLSYSTALLRENSKLTDYPVGVQTYGNQITVVGVATKGCRIVYEVSQQCRQLEDFLYLSCDEDDVVSIPSSERKIIFQMSAMVERTPARVRGIVSPQLDQVRRLPGNAACVRGLGPRWNDWVGNSSACRKVRKAGACPGRRGRGDAVHF